MAKVLVADDVKAMRDLLRQILESDGHEVKETATGSGVVNILTKEHQFDLVLLDIGMPDLNGIETMKKISQIEENLPKVCFVTGEKDQKTVVQALQAGGSDFIVKPIDIIVFKEKMNQLIGGSVESIIKIKTNLAAEVPQFPVPVNLTIVEMSELGLVIQSSIKFNENSNINIVSNTLSDLLAEDFEFPCLIKSVVEREKEGIFELKCDFVGLHDSNRQKIRCLTMKGVEIHDPISENKIV